MTFNSFCRDEVSGPLAIWWVFRSDGGRLVTDGPQSFEEAKTLSYPFAHALCTCICQICSGIGILTDTETSR